MVDTTSDAQLPDNFSFTEVSDGRDATVVSRSLDFVDPTSVSGKAPMRFISQNVKFQRRLYKLQGIDVGWIGIAIPMELYREPIPHIFFHPTAGQAGISDANYAAFDNGWKGVYWDYSFWMGAQISAAKNSQQALVIPFYKTGQAQNLGNFNRYWQPVLVQLLTDAVNKKDPLIIYGNEVRFPRICTSSFSVGIAVHRHFQSRGAGVQEMTDKIFDLDGKFGPGAWSFWAPSNGVIYQDRRVKDRNPQGNVYRVGQRWEHAFSRQSRAERHRDTHWLTAQYMLYHGLMMHAATR